MIQILFIITILVYLISIFYAIPSIQFVVSSLSLLIIIVSFFKTKRFVQVLGLVFISTGVILLIYHGASFLQFINSFGLLLNLLTLFALIPILGIPIRLGKYANQINKIVNEKVKTPEKLYAMTSTLSYSLSFFMHVATLPVVYYAMRPATDLFNIKNREKFMTHSILHGFTMPLLWTPTAPIVIAVLTLNEISWIKMLPYFIPLSVSGFILNLILGFRLLKKENNEKSITQHHKEIADKVDSEEQEAGGPVSTVILGIISFFIIIFLAELLTPLDILFIVTIVVIPFSLAWSLLIKQGKQFLKECQDHFVSKMLTLTDQFYIFLAAGFLISTTRLTGTDESIRVLLGHVSHLIGSGVFVTLLPLVPLLLAFIGMHPIVSLSLMAEALNADLLGVSREVLTISMASGAVTAFLMGPYNATIGLMSTITGENPYAISRWNTQFTIGFLIIVIALLMTLQMIGL